MINLYNMTLSIFLSFFFFFNDTATTEIYTLSLHDALPISLSGAGYPGVASLDITDNVVPFIANEEEKIERETRKILGRLNGDRKSTRLNSSHGYISYAVFCLKKKKKIMSDVSDMNPTTRHH